VSDEEILNEEFSSNNPVSNFCKILTIDEFNNIPCFPLLFTSRLRIDPS
jgi:hypothetical protein